MKAYPDDEFELDSFWVFTDFGRKLGIAYPDPLEHPPVCLPRLDERFLDKLPET